MGYAIIILIAAVIIAAAIKGVKVVNNKYLMISDTDAFKKKLIIKEKDITVLKVCAIATLIIMIYVVIKLNM